MKKHMPFSAILASGLAACMLLTILWCGYNPSGNKFIVTSQPKSSARAITFFVIINFKCVRARVCVSAGVIPAPEGWPATG